MINYKDFNYKEKYEPDEKTAYKNYIHKSVNSIIFATFGLTPGELVLTPTNSALSLSGILKHSIYVLNTWEARIRDTYVDNPDAFTDSFKSDTPLETLLEMAKEELAKMDKLIDEADFDALVNLPPRPWWKNKEMSVRKTFNHLSQEFARHAGHADIIRENIDKKTSWELHEEVEKS